MERITKPVLMPLVLLNALLALEGSLAPKWVYTLLSFALCFHCAGDIFLMVGSFQFFAAGLLFFHRPALSEEVTKFNWNKPEGL